MKKSENDSKNLGNKVDVNLSTILPFWFFKNSKILEDEKKDTKEQISIEMKSQKSKDLKYSPAKSEDFKTFNSEKDKTMRSEQYKRRKETADRGMNPIKKIDELEEI